MCLAVPMRIIEKKDESGMVEAGGVKYEVDLSLVPDVRVGDYVIVHTGFAIEKLDTDEADKTIQLFKEFRGEE